VQFYVTVMSICVIVLLLSSLVFLPGAMRLKALRASNIGVRSGTARWNASFSSRLRASGFVDSYSRNGRDFTFAYTADSSGLGFWRGVLRPERFGHIDWSAIRAIHLGVIDNSLRPMGALCVELWESPESLSFAVTGKRSVATLRAGSAELKTLVRQLEQDRLAAVGEHK
jgi:hypothetical protein